MNVFLVIGNIINFVYNIPQVVKTYKTKSTKDFSPTFLFMRVVGNCIWLAYSIELKAFLFILSNIVSVISSIFVSYYKAVEIYMDYFPPLELDDARLMYSQINDRIGEEEDNKSIISV
jgi:MtN3 and saliva related transmembrane protein